MNITFCGHSQTSDQDKIASWLDMILPALIEGGATTFYLGGYGDFDLLAAAAVRRQKNAYPHVESVLVLPYLNREFDSTNYDSTQYPPLENVPPPSRQIKTNPGNRSGNGGKLNKKGPAEILCVRARAGGTAAKL